MEFWGPGGPSVRPPPSTNSPNYPAWQAEYNQAVKNRQRNLNATKKIRPTNANRKNAKKVLNAALVASASPRKVDAAKAAFYAKLLKDGKENNAKVYMDAVVRSALNRGKSRSRKNRRSTRKN